VKGAVVTPEYLLRFGRATDRMKGHILRKEYEDLRKERARLIRNHDEHRHVGERMEEVSWEYRELTGGSIQ
jgi:hypothetical protein